MNQHLPIREGALAGGSGEPLHARLPRPGSTQAAEGLPRREWRRAEIEAMLEAGIIEEDERFELIGGEVVPMSPKGGRHEWVKMELNRHLAVVIQRDWNLIQESTLWLDDTNFVEPDFCIWPRTIMPTEQSGHDVVLAIDIADSSLRYDLDRKIPIYAAYGVAEVWVIDAVRLVTRVHREPGAAGYGDVFEAAPADELVAQRVPQLAVNLAALGLSPA